MKIRYANTMADLVAFNRYHVCHSPATRRMLAVVTWALPAVVLLAAVALAAMDESPALLLTAAAFTAIWVGLFRVLFPLFLDRQVRRLYREGQNKGTLGPHELELADGRLVERTPYGEQATLLQAVERVACTDDYAFIYVSALAAHVVPRQAVVEGDYQAFTEAVERQRAKACHEASPLHDKRGGLWGPAE